MQRQPTFRGFSDQSGDSFIQGGGTMMRIMVPGFPPPDCRPES